MGKRPEGVTEYTWGARKSRKKIILISSAAVVVVAAAVAGFLFFSKGEKPPTNSTNASLGPNMTAGQYLPRKIDGVMAIVDKSNVFPVAIMIENLVSARPQAGLGDANVVYEALAEGGITRFMAIFASGADIKKIGPVRSARPYYLDWAKEYGALYVHIGGSPQAIADIKAKGVFDLNQFYHSPNFYRDSARPAPHNLYTTTRLLAFALRDLKASDTGSYDSWTFKDPENTASLPTDQKTIEIDFSSFSYKVDYTFDREKNIYLRNQAGAPHLDADGKQITARNVIVQYTKTSLADSTGRLTMVTTGEGRALFFRDGSVIQGSWKKDQSGSRTRYVDASGNDIQLNRGTTWVEIVPDDRQVVYK